MNIRSIILITIFFTFSITSPIIGSENYYRTLADLKARPTGMGGAYLAVPSDLSCILYNPATLTQEERLNSHVNVLAFIKKYIKYIMYFVNGKKINCNSVIF